MSTDTKYQVMGELLGIMPAAIEKAEEQASRIIEMVRGEGCFAPVITSRRGVQIPESRPKRHPVPTAESKAITAQIVLLRSGGMEWHEIADEVGISKKAAQNRYAKWQKKLQVTIEPISSMEIYEPGAEDARQEAEAAEATIRSSLSDAHSSLTGGNRVADDLPEATIRKSLTVEEQIGQFIRCMIINDPNAMDFDILQAVKRNFPGISMNVADIRSRR